MLKDIISPYQSSFTLHTELRAQQNTTRRVTILAGEVVGNSRTDVGGVSARVYKNGVYGFASGADYTEENVKNVLTAAERNAVFMDSRVQKGGSPIMRLPQGIYRMDREVRDIEQKRYIDFARALDDRVGEKYPDLASHRVVVSCDSMEKLLAVADGCCSYSLMPRSYVYVVLTAPTNTGDTVELYAILGGGGYFDEYFDDPAAFDGKIDEVYQHLKKKAEGIYAEAGVKDVVMHPNLAGMLAHEAVGHTVEADLVLGGSVAGPMLGKRVASDLITMVDFAHTLHDGTPAPLPVYVDDEGTPASDEVLIKDGILTGYMNSRESAARFGMQPHGNARAYLFSDEPLIRMRNTGILPGRDKLEDMIAAIDDGYYLVETGNGQADTTGEFMFGINVGYEIKHGKLGRAIRDTTISGVAFEMLKTVDMLSNDNIWVSSGFCGKKQPMPVGMGGPAIKCRVNIGGR